MSNEFALAAQNLAGSGTVKKLVGSTPDALRKPLIVALIWPSSVLPSGVPCNGLLLAAARVGVHLEYRVIERIQRVHAELDSASALAQAEILLQRGVEKLLPRTARSIQRARRIAVLAQRRALEQRPQPSPRVLPADSPVGTCARA